MTKNRVEHQTVVTEWFDMFIGLADFEPIETDHIRYETQTVEVKPLTKAQRKKVLQKVIDKLDPPREVIAPKAAKRAPKPKAPPKPKKGKPVAQATQILIKSPFDKFPQWVALVPSISELLLEGWVIIDGGDVPANEAYEFLNFNPEELQSA